MSREVRRVPVGFDWPLRKVWQGYLMPEELRALDCPDCEGGYSPEAKRLKDLWYGYIPFKPEDNGSTPFAPDDPEVDAFARRNVARSPDYYGAAPVLVEDTSEGEAFATRYAIRREARRLANLWNGAWSHHLNEADVAALKADGRLWGLADDVTPEQVNRWSLQGFGHDAINAHICVQARCEAEGASATCGTCGGSAEAWRDADHKAAHEAWTETEPPEGEGWQVWETVSEGSPVTPAFATREELVGHLCTPEQRVTLRDGAMSRWEAEAFVDAGWVPSFISSSRTGIVEGALMPAAEAN